MTSMRRSDAIVLAGGTAVAALVCWIAVKDVVSGSSVAALTAIGICAAPMLGYLAFRWPVIFPFGLYALLVPLDNILQIGGGATLTKLVGIVSAGALIVRILILRRALAPGRAWLAWAFAILYMYLSTTWSVSAQDSLTWSGYMLALFGTYTVATMYPVSRSEVVTLCGIVVLSGIGLAGYAVQQYLSGSMGTDARLSIGTDDYSIDPNHFAASFLLPISLSAMGFLAFKGRLVRVALAAATFAMGVGILLTGSRGGLISFGVVLLYIGIRTRRVRETVTIAIAGLGAGLALPTAFNRFNDPTQGEAGGRFFIWEVVLPAISKNFHWLYGYGFATFPNVYDDAYLAVYQRASAGYHRPGHNLFAQSSVELGLIGLGLILFAWFQTWRTTDNIPSGTPWFALRVACEASVIALFITAMSVDVLWFKYLWLAFTLAAIARNGYAPTPLFGRRAAASRRVAASTADVTAAINSISVADFEHTTVAPEM